MSEKNEIQKIEIKEELKDLISFGIEELESRQEMALISAQLVDGEGNSKCTTNSGCNTVKGCGVSETTGVG